MVLIIKLYFLFSSRHYAAEEALVPGTLVITKSFEGVVNDFGEIACFALQLLARICSKTGRNELSASAHKRALKLNPFLWQSYTELCNQGAKVDPNQIFQFSSDMFQTCQSQNSFVGVREATAGIHLDSCNPNAHHVINTPTVYSPSMLTTPVDQNINNNQPNPVRAIAFEVTPNLNTPTPPSITVGEVNKPVLDRPPIETPLKRQFKYFSNLSPLTPSFGVMPLGSSPPVVLNDSNALYLSTPKYQNQEQIQQQRLVVAKKIKSHKLNNIKRKDSPMPEMKPFYNHVNNITNVRRSSRLFSSSYSSVKENNNKGQEQQQPNLLANNINNKFVTPKSPPRKAKQRISSKLTNVSLKASNINASMNELTEKSILGEKPEKVETVTSKDESTMLQHVMNLKMESVEGLMSLLRELGQGFAELSQYNCLNAIEAFESIAPKHQESTWVQSMLALSHFELRDFDAAVKIFKKIHTKEPSRMHLMEIYSTALWHLQKEVELSALAQELMAQTKSSPITWCVAGNCFSLHKEHEAAIKFFQRAVQVDPDFVYSYILLGHEFVITEELEKALSCFRTAILKDFRHYNAWFGIGTIYSKQEKFQLAELHYAKALLINPRNSVIMVHIGAIQLFSKQMDKALVTLNKAIKLDPKNPLCKFNRGRLYFAMKRYEEALQELEELKEIVPKESVIYYLIGKIHKQMGNYDLGLMHFSWASDLDPKGANNQIKETFENTTVGGDSGVPGGGLQTANNISGNSEGNSPSEESSSFQTPVTGTNNNNVEVDHEDDDDDEAQPDEAEESLANNTPNNTNNTLQGIAELEATPTQVRPRGWNLLVYDNDTDSDSF